MDIPSKYDSSKTEDKWYAYWMEHKLFHAEPDDREPYTIVIPPPNVTGVLHMGHMLNNTIQDVFIRKNRMEGKNTLWVPGTDHASIATEARVVNKLKQEGIDKNNISREDFLKHAWEWTEKHGGIILEQLKKLGASCDWDRTKFTMDEDLSESVIKVFVELYRKGYIYRGTRVVNWDPQAKTAISDEEVVYREVQSKLYYIRYKMQEGDESVVIATTRPETILGDTAVCVHPEDERYRSMHAEKVLIPLIDRPVEIIPDDYVDREFGTGALKITPAHDENDYEIGLRHNLESIDILNDDGSLNSAAQILVGEDRFEARKKIIAMLKAQGYLVREEDYLNKVGFSERTDAVTEPKLSRQWFLDMKKLAGPALEHVMNDDIRLVPPKFKNTYRYWMENIKDWCISRQLWWGHRIPAWYINSSRDFVVAHTEEEAVELVVKQTGNKDLSARDLKQDEDVLDTWFSSWLWPISVFDGIRNPENKDFKYFYPTSDLITAPDILFFWVARMIMAGYELTGEKPFGHVYLTGMVRDNQRRKMSKSLGNSPEPMDLIKKYSADGVRVGMLLCSPAGNDLLYDDSLPEQGRNFGNKIWNAFRLINQWTVGEGAEQPEYAQKAVEWFEHKLSQTLHDLDSHFKKFRISDALMVNYRLFWDDFSSWFLEIVKPPRGKAMDRHTHAATINIMEKLVLMLHPFMPFITEEIWQLLKERKEGESIMNTRMPRAGKYNKMLLEKFEHTKQVVSSLRNLRAEKNIPSKELIRVFIRSEKQPKDTSFHPIILKLSRLESIRGTKEEIKQAASFRVGTHDYFVPLGDLADHETELKKLREELDYTRGFLKSVQKKLGNERFVQNAPEAVVEKERKKLTDAEEKIRLLEGRIGEMGQ